MIPNKDLQQAAIGEAAVQATRERMVYFGNLLFQRQLTDAAGGNISVRVATPAGDVLCITPKHAGQKRQWQLAPEDVLVADLDRNILDGYGVLSREANAHFGLHHAFGEYGKAVIHAHARNVMVFAALGRAMPAVIEATRKFGEIPVSKFAPSHTPALAEHIIAAMQPNASGIAKHAAAVIAPWHGLFCMGRDLDAAFDAVERIDTNAYCILMGHHLINNNMMLEAARQQMEGAVTPYEAGYPEE